MYLIEFKNGLETVCFKLDVTLENDSIAFEFYPYKERFLDKFPSDSACQSVEAEDYGEEEYTEASCSEHGTTVSVDWLMGRVTITTKLSDIVRYSTCEDMHCVDFTDEVLSCVRGLVRACKDARASELKESE